MINANCLWDVNPGSIICWAAEWYPRSYHDHRKAVMIFLYHSLHVLASITTKGTNHKGGISPINNFWASFKNWEKKLKNFFYRGSTEWQSMESAVYVLIVNIVNFDDSFMLSSIKSMKHQFYIEHRKHWWLFDVTPIFHPCLKCFSTLKPMMFPLININNSSMKHWWIINETMMNHRWRNSCVYVFYGWI